MNSEIKIIIAFLFKRSGKKEMTQSELYLTLSIDLKWFSPQKAKEFVNSTLQNNILVKKGAFLTPTFDVNKITIPTGFHPSKEVFYKQKEEEEEEIPDIIENVVKRIAEDTGMNVKDIFEKIKYAEREKNVLLEVAALLIGREYDIALDSYFEGAERKIFK
ncbi:MAG: DUF2240 family protein [Candidatus Thermoplasmatota archaeon]|nr:DUF2240 family protein [Candidatus Thermoplasmatota archaeon]